jgi:hypothetical protein
MNGQKMSHQCDVIKISKAGGVSNAEDNVHHELCVKVAWVKKRTWNLE